jgi:predicted peroxiredoxin
MADRRPLMYVGLHGTDDPTLASLPFVVATGAATAEIDACVVLLGEAANLAKPGMISATYGVGFAPLAEVWQKVRDFNVPVYV